MHHKVKLTEPQYLIATDNHRYKIICAGRRFGKSTLARLMIYKWAVEKPGLYWIVSPTYTQSVQNHWSEMEKEIPPEWIRSKYKDRYFIFKNGSKLELKGADNPDSLRGVKLRGLCVDEIASIRYWSWLWEEVLGATLMDYSAPAVFIGTPKGFNHFYELFNLGQKTESEYKSWRYTTYDNPHIPRHEIDKKKQTLMDDVFYQEYMADFRKHTGLVYKDFDRFTHVRELPGFKPVFYMRGLDRGFQNPTAVPLIAVDKDGRWYQTHEIYKRHLTPSMVIQELRNQESVSGINLFEYQTMDSASAGDIAELNQAGFDFIPVTKSSGESNLNYVRWKIQKLADRLRIQEDKQPRYYVHPRCEETIREFESYSWPEKKQPTLPDSEQPEKLNDHMMDALADLNGMYYHDYEEKKKDPTRGKVPGTFIEMSPVEEEDDNNGWGPPAQGWGYEDNIL